MPSEQETPKSPEEILAGKKSQLADKIDLMLDWQKSERIKKSLLPQIDGFSGEELDYLLEKVRNLDNETQFRGPLAAAAGEFKSKSDNILMELGANIDPNRIKELDQLFSGEK